MCVPRRYRQAHGGPLSSSIALHLSLNMKLTMKPWLAGQKTPRVCLSLPHGTGVTGVHSQDQICNVGSVVLNLPQQYLIVSREEQNGKSLINTNILSSQS